MSETTVSKSSIPGLDRLITPQEREVIARAGYGDRSPVGVRPALLIIDVLYNFAGFPGKSLEESMRDFRNSCGPAAWDSIEVIRRLLDVAHGAGVPVVYSGGTRDPQAPRISGTKNRHNSPTEHERTLGRQIVDEISPVEGDAVIRKQKASAFFGTPLASYLTARQVDSLIVCGGSTSGCVRATVQDGFAHGYTVAVVREGVFDRIESSHLMNLFDMDAKYADVVDELEATSRLRAAAGRPTTSNELL